MQENDIPRAFEAVYNEDRWSHGSGPGSLPSSTIEYRSFLERFIQENGVKTVTDLGCGDWQSSRYMNWSSVRYTGLDVVQSLIDENNKRYAAGNISFHLSRSLDSLPGGDLLISKEVLQHLPNKLIAAYLDAISQRYKFALLTNSIAPGSGVNSDIEAGGYRPLRLEAAPFHAPGAIVLVYYPTNGHYIWRNAVFLMLGKVK